MAAKSVDNKAKLLFVGNSPTILHSGQSVVSRALCARLSQVFELAVAGWGYNGEVHGFPFHIYPSNYEWWRVIKDFKPDVLFLSHDVWRFAQLVSVRKEYPDLKIVGYFTIDGDPLPGSWIPILDCCDLVLVPSRFGKEVIEERWTVKPVLVVPQGVEPFFFVDAGEDKENLKKEVDEKTFKMASELNRSEKDMILYSNKFVVFFCGMNQTKKNIGTILDGFTEFAHGKNDVCLNLILHSHVFSQFGLETVGDYDVRDMYSWMSERDKIYLVDAAVNDDTLKSFYGVADVLLSPSIGEGFGLFVLEAMAAKVIPILTEYSAFIEWPDRNAMFLMKPDALFRSYWNVNRAIVSSDTVARTLERAYTVWKYAPERWRKMQELNQQRVLMFTWDVCVQKIVPVLVKLINGEIFIKTGVKRL